MPMISVEQFNQRGAGKLPGHLGIVVTHATREQVRAQMPVCPQVMAPNGYLHAGSLVTLADTLCGYGCLLNLPDGASGFTTVELKSNHLGTTLDGTVAATATPAHLGRTTQVWQTEIHRADGRLACVSRLTTAVVERRE